MFSESMVRRIEIWPIERLIPYARNPRTHSPEQVAQIGDAPEWQRLYDRREEYMIGTVPKGGLFLTAGVDIQKEVSRSR